MNKRKYHVIKGHVYTPEAAKQYLKNRLNDIEQNDYLSLVKHDIILWPES